METIITNHPQTKLTSKIKIRLAQEIKSLYLNKELIDFVSSKIPNTTNDKLAYLFYFRKIVQQVHRKPDAEHYKAFEELYEAERILIADEQAFYEPIKWLNAEIEYIQSLSTHVQVQQREQMEVLDNAQAATRKDWLTRKEVMKMLDRSSATLNRWISDGMPCHKKGRSVYFYLDEISEYLKREAA